MRFVPNFLARLATAVLFVGFINTAVFAQEVSGDPLSLGPSAGDRKFLGGVCNYAPDQKPYEFNFVNDSQGDDFIQQYNHQNGHLTPCCDGPWSVLHANSTYTGFILPYTDCLQMTGASGRIVFVK